MASVRNKPVTGGGSSRHLSHFLKFAWISLGAAVQGLGGCAVLPSLLAHACAHSPRAGLAGVEEEGRGTLLWKLSHLLVWSLCAVFNLKSELQWRLRAVAPSSALFPPSAMVSIPPPSWLVQHLLPCPGLERGDITLTATPWCFATTQLDPWGLSGLQVRGAGPEGTPSWAPVWLAQPPAPSTPTQPVGSIAPLLGLGFFL